jgi:hypothetical protein
MRKDISHFRNEDGKIITLIHAMQFHQVGFRSSEPTEEHRHGWRHSLSQKGKISYRKNDSK